MTTPDPRWSEVEEAIPFDADATSALASLQADYERLLIAEKHWKPLVETNAKLLASQAGCKGVLSELASGGVTSSGGHYTVEEMQTIAAAALHRMKGVGGDVAEACGKADHNGRVCTLPASPGHAHDWQFCHEEGEWAHRMKGEG